MSGLSELTWWGRIWRCKLQCLVAVEVEAMIRGAGPRLDCQGFGVVELGKVGSPGFCSNRGTMREGLSQSHGL